MLLPLPFSAVFAGRAQAQFGGTDGGAAAGRGFFTWYDSVGGADWILVADPDGVFPTSSLQIEIGGAPMEMPAQEAPAGYLDARAAAAGMTVASFPGIKGGPVAVSYDSSGEPLISQRILWAGTSMEEIFATTEDELSDHYIWSWYDMASPGFEDWVLLGNTGADPVYFEISLGGEVLESGSIDPGSQVTPTFPGVIGGPLEARAWTGPEKLAPARMVASQRLLAGGVSFSETPGIPADSLSDRYLWTWYDMQSAGSSDWVLLGNAGSRPVWYEIRIAGQAVGSGSIEAGASLDVTFEGLAGGPVEVQAWGDEGRTFPARITASRRLLWGPSFEEVPGAAAGTLKSEYHWTWYDMRSSGMSNWVTIANPNRGAVYFELLAGGAPLMGGRIDPGGVAAPTLNGFMGGPVAVKAWADAARTAPAPVIASQRVLFKGFLNELTGSGRDGAPETGGFFSGFAGGSQDSSGESVAAGAGAPPVSVKEFGAAGDGLNDDTVALQSAVASASNVFLPEGVYRVTSTISIAADGVRLSGAGAGSVIFADMDKNAVEFTGDGGYVGNLAIEGNGRPVTPADGRTAVKFYDADNGTAEHLLIRNVNTGGVGTGGSIGCRGTVIRDVTVENVREHGVYLSTAEGAIVENVKVDGAGRNLGVAGSGLKIADSSGVRVYGFRSTGSLNAGVIAEASGDETSSRGIELVDVESIAPAPGQYGLYLNRDVSGVLVSGGYFEGDTGIRMGGNPGDFPASVTITNASASGRVLFALDAAWGEQVMVIGGAFTGPAGDPAVRTGPDARSIDFL